MFLLRRSYPRLPFPQREGCLDHKHRPNAIFEDLENITTAARFTAWSSQVPIFMKRSGFGAFACKSRFGRQVLCVKVLGLQAFTSGARAYQPDDAGGYLKPYPQKP